MSIFLFNPTVIENETTDNLTEINSENDFSVCFKEGNTVVCGKLIQFNYLDLEDKVTVEPFFGECDLFGF